MGWWVTFNCKVKLNELQRCNNEDVLQVLRTEVKCFVYYTGIASTTSADCNCIVSVVEDGKIVTFVLGSDIIVRGII